LKPVHPVLDTATRTYHDHVSTRISDLSSKQLLELVRGAALDDFQTLEVLRSPFCTPQIADLVAADRERLSLQAVRETLASFPGLNNAQAMNLLGSLPWSSLMAVAQTPRTPPIVRRQAERKLLQLVGSMTLGEKIAMARRAHRALLPSLMETGDERVLIALLDNPRLTENDLAVLVNTGEPPDGLLPVLARHHRWGRCYGVLRAVAQSRRCPLPLALSILVQLAPRDLRRIAARNDVSEGLRTAAGMLLDRGRGGRRPRPAQGT
jgi:hypothetical protein